MDLVSLDSVASDLRDPLLQLEVDLDGIEITESMSLQHDLQMDSLDLMDFLVHIEKKYGVKIADDKLDTVDTVGDVVHLLNDLVGAR